MQDQTVPTRNTLTLGQLYTSSSTQLTTKCGNLYIHLLSQKGELKKILVNLGKTGVCPMAFLTSHAAFIAALIGKVSNGILVGALSEATGQRCGADLSETCIEQMNRFILERLLENRTEESEDKETEEEKNEDYPDGESGQFGVGA